jgi:hypothetical protein
MRIDSFHVSSSLTNEKVSGKVTATQNESPAQGKAVITTGLSVSRVLTVGTPSVGTPSVGTPSVRTPGKP